MSSKYPIELKSEVCSLVERKALTSDGVPRKVKKATVLLRQALKEGSDLAKCLFIQGYFH